MQKVMNCFMGVDISKLWVDAAMVLVGIEGKAPMLTARFNNDQQGFKAFTKWLRQHQVPFSGNTLIVIENTGVYHRRIWQYCTENNLSLHIGNATHIKWSMGITRGKSDHTDAERLCTYCLRHAEELKASPALDAVVLQLKDLARARTRLLEQLKSIRTYLCELRSFSDKAIQKQLEQSHQAALQGLRRSLKQVEAKIHELIEQHHDIKNNYKLLLSVPGIGPVTALYLICCTANFASKITGKQLACYCGVVPFEHQSGKSIKAKPRVHKMANKQLKSLLHMGARSIANYHPEFKSYYQRKQKEGKHALSIINAIKNKIALRAVAVIQKQTPYVDNLKKIN